MESINRFRKRLVEGCLDPDEVSEMARDAAHRVIEEFTKTGDFPREAVELLCEITANRDTATARRGTRVLFTDLIEILNDSFDPKACRLYDRIFSQVIDYYRHFPGGENIDVKLSQFGIAGESDLLKRKERRRLITRPDSHHSVMKVILLSRVTIGADVLINSTIIAKLREILPHAEFVIVGSGKLRELYGGDRNIRVNEIRYERGGTVLSRLQSWLGVVSIIDQETEKMNADQWWLIDADSRLTQLGLLPLQKNDPNYFFFESRSYEASHVDEGSPSSLGRLASHWMGEIIGSPVLAYPFISLPDEYRAIGDRIGHRLRDGRALKILTVSFGVGGNHNKRVSDEFEERLIRELARESALILDKGATEDERQQINRLTSLLLSMGKKVVELNEERLTESDLKAVSNADAVAWAGGIGSFAGLIAASNEYLGYDSAGQHIAAALGIPTLAILVNASTSTFAERWHPYGRGPIRVIAADAATAACESDRILADVIETRKEWTG